MPRNTKDDMKVNVAGLRRNIINLAHNYSDAQIKVREATSNDPWGPSSTLMAEIADLTYNVMAFTEIMQMIWKRLNDHGKNWRHVYKALVLMEYLIKTGSEKVAMQCKENVFAIHTLKDFQYLEEGKDQGLNVREKAKQLVILLKDEEKLKNERARALKAKERFAQSASAFGSDSALDTPSSPPFTTMGSGRDSAWSDRSSTTIGELETARPQTIGEEELQLQLALAVSREEAERDERRRRSDNVRLQLALSQSEQDFKGSDRKNSVDKPQQSHLLDLLDVSVGSPSGAAGSSQGLDPWGAPPTPPQRPQSLDVGYEDYFDAMQQSADPWSTSTSSPPGLASPPLTDPWSTKVGAAPPVNKDPWAPLDNDSPLQNILVSPSSDLEFDMITNRSRVSEQTNGSSNNNNHSNGGALSPDPFDLSLLGDNLNASNANPSQPAKRTPQSFLGENSSLVNLDNLIKPINGGDTLFGSSTSSYLQNSANPFSPDVPPSRPNLFQAQTQHKPSMNEIKQQPAFAATSIQQDPWAPVQSSSPSPWMPAPTKPHSTTPNPFLS